GSLGHGPWVHAPRERSSWHEMQPQAAASSEGDEHACVSVGAAGRVNWNRAPLGSAVSAQIRPPWDSTIERVMARPRPTPAVLVVKNGSNTRAMASASMPEPRSSMATETPALVAWVRMNIARLFAGLARMA